MHNGFVTLTMSPFSLQQVRLLVRKSQFYNDTKQKFLRELKLGEYQSHESFLRNPLLITIMLLTLRYFGRIAKDHHVFYEEAFETLVARHVAMKDGRFARQMHSTLKKDQLKELFSAFSAITYLKGALDFQHSELVLYFTAVRLSTRVWRNKRVLPTI
jgi:hypothetical protein